MMLKKSSSFDKYNEYKFEDFLNDDLFINSIQKPTAESILFWKEFEETGFPNLHEFQSAKLFVESISQKKDDLSEDEISNLWTNIESSNKKFFSRNRIIVVLTAIAASIVGLFFVNTFFEPSQKYDLVTLAEDLPTINNSSEEILLILSNNETLIIHNDNSEIIYNKENLEVDGKNIPNGYMSSFNQLVVPKGKRSNLTLADGTKVWINAGTRLIYPIKFDEKERELYVDGEIYIHVASDKNWPFVVKTKDISINVLGTEFNVNAYETDNIKQVVLASGSVKIIGNDGGKKDGILLTPNKAYEYSDTKGEVKSVDIYKYISWKDGMYIFENENLSVILNKLARYYGKSIECDQLSNNLKCSGKLDLKNSLDEVLNGLSFTVPITYSLAGSHYSITYSDKK